MYSSVHTCQVAHVHFKCLIPLWVERLLNYCRSEDVLLPHLHPFFHPIGQVLCEALCHSLRHYCQLTIRVTCTWTRVRWKRSRHITQVLSKLKVNWLLSFENEPNLQLSIGCNGLLLEPLHISEPGIDYPSTCDCSAQVQSLLFSAVHLLYTPSAIT